MRIAQISTPLARTPPIGYGGTEAIVSYLTEELVALGHDVTLFATGDSVTKAQLWPWDETPVDYMPPRVISNVIDEVVYTLRAAKACAFIAEESFDIVHNHFIGPGLLNMLSVPSITTTHILLEPEYYRIYAHSHRYVSITHSQRMLAPDLNWVGTVYHGIRVEDFPFDADKDDYLLFIGAINALKCPHIAIQVAQALGMRLKIAGPVLDPVYYQKIAPFIDGHQIEYVGEANFAQKTALYKSAFALLFPLNWEEPFGLVAIEALACGTPVIAFTRGATSETIADGQVGFLVNTVDEMIAAVEKVKSISPHECRNYVKSKFNTRLMARNYIDVYAHILALQM